jgi:antitoxin YefM
MNTVTLHDAKQDLDKLIAEVIASAEPTILSTEAGEQIVLLSMDEWNSWQETLYLLSNSANAAHLRKSIEEAQAGKVVERVRRPPSPHRFA